jgi:flagellar FliJ protein
VNGAFRLATVLRVRRVQEEQARAELLRGNRAAREAHRAWERSTEHYRNVPVSTGPVAAATFRREIAAADMAAATLATSAARLTSARAEAESAFGVWRQAAQRVEALERLEQRRRDEELAAESRRETAAVDELVTARFTAAAEPRSDDRGDAA